MRSYLSIILLLCVCGGALPPVLAGDDNKKGADAKGDGKDGDKEKKEKPKEPPLKCSAWCAFKNVVNYEIQQKNYDPKVALTEQGKHETRIGAFQWGGFGRRGQWATIILELQNTTEDSTFRGTGSINLNAVNENQAGQIPYKTNYRQELEVGPQTTKQFRFSVLCPEDWNESSKAVRIDLNLNAGSEVRDVTITNIDALREEFIAVVSENSGYGFLTGKVKGGRVAEDADAEETKQLRQVAWVEAKDLPTRWHDLTICNLIIIDGPPQTPEKISDVQWAALKSYVQAGGHILVTAGKDPSKLKGPLEDLCGIEVRGGTVDVESLDEIRPGYQPVVKEWAMTLVDVKVNEDARRNTIIRRNHKTGCVEYCKRFYGAGSVTFLPFSLNDPKLMMWAGKTAIPLAIMERSAASSLFGTMSPEDVENIRAKPQRNMWGYQQPPPQVARDAMVKLRRDLDDSFRSDTPVQIKKSASVLSFLLLYLLCAVPGNYFLFGWFRRREIAWLAVPIWGASFSVGAYVVGYMGQTGRLTVNELTIVEAGSREDIGMARTFFGIYAPRRDEYQVEFPTEKSGKDDFDVQAAPGHLVNVASSEEARTEMPSLSIVDSASGLSIERMLIQQRSTRRLEITHRVQIGDGLDVRVKPNAADSKATDIEVTNNTGYDLNTPVYLYRGRALDLHSVGGDVLKAGASAKYLGVGSRDGIQWIVDQGTTKAKDTAFFGKSVYFRTVRGQRAKDRTDALKNYLRERVEKFQEGVVLAWIEKAPLPAKIFDSSHRPMEIGNFEGLTLLMVPVSVRHGGNSSQLAAGKGPIDVRYSTNYITGGAVKWKGIPSARPGASFGTQKNAAGTVDQSIMLQFKAPENSAELHNEGCHLRLITFFIEKLTETNTLDWEQTGEIPFDLKNAGKPGASVGVRHLSFDLPLGDYRIINNNVIHLMLKADITEAAHALDISNATVVIEEE
jgi:hypothetical protein